MNQKIVIGNAEAICLPELGIPHLEARIDTGAQTSSLHVDNIECFEKNGRSYVEFDLHPDVYHLEQVVRCTAPLKANRKVKSSNGTFEHRCVITTMLRMKDQQWPIDITLTNRENMTYMMLLGRQAMSDKVLVDPSQSHMLAP
ncbi:ATP-dependent zinc protease [Vibrio sp. EA2]|uniref:ATP-dependent zinc protease family protein n=1 Tax=Vibrio sp. EA2 TaxID=3079860 RepID=UPI00294A4F12|nr:RimK/LysX family protein [Vibrio sp. EA2]MDV6252204.1 RimK/LysX family protein [Vibrio sp. EA2]